MPLTNQQQKAIWNQEHKEPCVLLQMDQISASSGIKKLYTWLQEHDIQPKNGLEMCCGKGRNCMWLASKGIQMHGFDFSTHAIQQATDRTPLDLKDSLNFIEQDASKKWGFPSDHFDITIDCFASSDIVESADRAFASSEMYRVTRPGGYCLVYTLSTEDQFHREMIEKYPADESGSFRHPETGKFEKVFTQQELEMLYGDFNCIAHERVDKDATFHGKTYPCSHHWMLFQKNKSTSSVNAY